MKKTARAECDPCGEDPAGACGRCGAAKYCSKECQRAHWKGGHNLVCVSPEKRQPAPLFKQEGDECAICLNPFEANTICTLMCGHSFHIDCLKKMIGKGGHTCPLCRAALPPAEIEYAPNVDVRLCRLAIQFNPSVITFKTFIRSTPKDMRKSLLLEATNYFPDENYFRHLISAIFVDEGDYRSALKQFDAILQSCKPLLFKISDETIYTMSNAFYNIAVTLYYAGEMSRSLVEINRLITHRTVFQGDYTMSDVYNVLGCVLSDSNDPHAQKEFKRAIQLLPDNVHARANWAKWLMPHEPHRASQMFSDLGIDPAAYTSYQCNFVLLVLP